MDVVSRESLKPRVRPKATTDAIYAFETERGSLSDLVWGTVHEFLPALRSMAEN